MRPDGAGLASRSFSAVFWSGGGAVFRLLLQLGTQVVLARLLGPEQYGIFAIGATVISFSAFFSDVGIAYGLIQKHSVESTDVRFVFTWQIVMGVVATTAVFISAPFIAQFFGEPRATDVVRALSFLCFLNAITAPSLNLLKRGLDFKTIQVAYISGYLVGYVLIGLPMALAGHQVWALVAAWLVLALTNGAMLYWKVRHPWGLLWWHPGALSQARYGGTVFITNAVNWAIGNIDRVIIGRFFGSRDIGLYATVYNLFFNASSTLLGVLQPVFFSTSARLQDEPARVASGYRALIGVLAVVIFPVFAVVAVSAETFVLALYGSAWRDAAAVCRPIALTMPFFLLFGLTTPLLWSTGHAGREFKIQLPVAVLWLVACAVAAQVSVVAVAWTVLTLMALRCALVLRAAQRAMALPGRELWAASRGGVALGGVLAGVAWLLSESIGAAWPSLVKLLVVLVGCGAVWVLLVRLIPGIIGADLAEVLRRLLGRAPSHLAVRLSFLTDRKGIR